MKAQNALIFLSALAQQLSASPVPITRRMLQGVATTGCDVITGSRMLSTAFAALSPGSCTRTLPTAASERGNDQTPEEPYSLDDDFDLSQDEDGDIRIDSIFDIVGQDYVSHAPNNATAAGNSNLSEIEGRATFASAGGLICEFGRPAWEQNFKELLSDVDSRERSAFPVPSGPGQCRRMGCHTEGGATSDGAVWICNDRATKRSIPKWMVMEMAWEILQACPYQSVNMKSGQKFHDEFGFNIILAATHC